MDINIAFLNPQSDISLSNLQPIESKQDFSIMIEKEIETNSNSENNEITLNSEKVILSFGSAFPVEGTDRENLKTNDAKNLEESESECAEHIFSVMINPLVSPAKEIESKPDYLEIVNTIQSESENEFENQENSRFETKDESNINNVAQNKEAVNINNIAKGQVEKNIFSEQLAKVSLMKTEKASNSKHESQAIKKDDVNLSENDKTDSVIASLIPSDVALESKSKNKIQSQLSAYENISEFNENSAVENEYIQADAKEIIQKGEINYDPSKTQSFEKELGEHLVSMIKENDHQVKLKVNPPELGNIDIDLNWSNEQANVSFYTGSAQVMTTIEASIAELKNLFNQQNLSLGDVNVFHQASDEHKRNHQDYNKAQKNENLESQIIKKSVKEKVNNPLSSGSISVFV